MSTFLFYAGVIAVGVFVADMSRLVVNVGLRYYALKRYDAAQARYLKKIEDKLTDRYLEMSYPTGDLKKEQIN